MNKPLNVCVLGGGSFGTALANIAATNGYPTRMWMRNAERVAEINSQHTNTQYLPETRLHDDLTATDNLGEALQDADVILVSVPSKSFATVMAEASVYAVAGQCWISTTKGIEEKGFALMSDILAREVPEARIGVLSGPNLAKEVAQKALTATVIASRDAGLRERVQRVLSCGYFRVYASTDMYGVELGGALKTSTPSYPAWQRP